jgi:hypothetical protein
MLLYGTESLIAMNPTAINIHRVEYSDDGSGGRQMTETDIPSFLARLVPTGNMDKARMVEAGISANATWVLITLPDADIMAGSDVEDTFEADGHKFKVVSVKMRKYGSKAYAKHAELEMIS